MSRETKSVVNKEDSFDLLDIRMGKIVAAEIEPSSPKQAYRLTVDFGKFGTKTSVARFTQHSIEEMVGTLVLGVLNFEARNIGDISSEVLILGVQFPKAESGEATPITPLNASAKLGGKLF